eukprot:TRINITY_DN4126_c0_g1_i3.p1 TRINITY_DN4126_c0_g1~~TRINITY_DN4126_c0_g1_i3.p1  ORF type:complete len:549 (-),score=50.08 TRINITY_DN4126_c0_g1_i3:690-2336(-)
MQTILLLLLILARIEGSLRRLQQAADCNYDFVDYKYCSHVPWYKGELQISGSRVNFAESSDYPFLVSLQLKKEGSKDCFYHFCAGTMIAPNLVLSAAHCFQEFVNTLSDKKWPTQPMYVSFYPQCRHQGNSNYSRIAVNEIHMHPLYRFNTKNADVAILTLQGYYDAVGGQIQLDLSDADRTGKKVEVVGYGYVRPTDKDGYNVYPLRKASFTVSSSSNCDEQLKLHGIIDGIFNEEGMICAYNPGADTCDGDSGGPIMLIDEDGKRTQIGVVSWGTGVQCKSSITGTPTVFTRLASFSDWIQQIVQEYGLGVGLDLANETPTEQPPTTNNNQSPSPSPDSPPPDVQEVLSEEDALMAFKEGLGNPPSLSGWQKGSDPCSWKEVTCNTNGKVTILDAVFYGFSGTMAVELSALRSLEEIYTLYSDIQGTLPASFSTWTSLKEAMLFKCGFTGTLPPTYSTWKSITFFSVADNQISGMLPEEYSTWKLIQTVSVIGNKFSGSIPKQYTSWSNIQQFNADEQDGNLCIPKDLQSYFSGVQKSDLRRIQTC